MGKLARGYNNNRNGWIMLLMILCGIVIGGFLGELLGKYFPILKLGYNFGVSPHTWDFIALKLTLGIAFSINVFSVIGVLLAIYLFKNMY